MTLMKKSLQWIFAAFVMLALSACGKTAEASFEEGGSVESVEMQAEGDLSRCGNGSSSGTVIEQKVAHSMADMYAAAPEDVMEMYCSGQSFIQLAMAYQTAAQIGISVEEVLAGVDAGMAWEQIWNELHVPINECGSDDDREIAESIATTYERPYRVIMGQFCQGSGFDDILLAMETEAQSSVPVQVLLNWRQAGTSWDQVWSDLGIVE